MGYGPGLGPVVPSCPTMYEVADFTAYATASVPGRRCDRRTLYVLVLAVLVPGHGEK